MKNIWVRTLGGGERAFSNRARSFGAKNKAKEGNHTIEVPCRIFGFVKLDTFRQTIPPTGICCPAAPSISPSSPPGQNSLLIRKIVNRLSGIYAPDDTLQAMRDAGGLLIGRQFKIAKDQIKLLWYRALFVSLPRLAQEKSPQRSFRLKRPENPRTPR